MVTKQVKAIELVFDWNLWPRHEVGQLDSTNLARMRQAILAGIKLPPVIVNQHDNRIIDGMHRTKVMLSLYGDDAMIEVLYKQYESEAEMFIDAARINNQHGLPLSPKDRVHVFLKARKMRIPIPAIAEALGMEVEATKKFIEDRIATSKSGEKIPLPGGAHNLKGKVLTKKQEEYVKSCPGTSAQLYARLLLNALNADAVIFNDKVVAALKDLKIKIEIILAEVA
jgi:hypothetical protein